jgi:hypothetical protein
VPIPSDTGFTFRVRAPEVFERGRPNLTKLEARLGGALVAPSSGVYTLTAPDGSTVVTGNVTISGSIAQYQVTANDLPDSLGFGDGYTESWDLTVAGVVQTGRREAYLARRALHCPVTQADLEALHPRLSTTMGNAAASLQGHLDEAWADTLLRLVAGGRWPEAIIEPTSLREYVRETALYYVFRSLIGGAGTGSDRYTALSDEHKSAALAAWGGIRYRQDFDQDGLADDETRRGPGGGVVSRSGATPWVYGAGLRRRVL